MSHFPASPSFFFFLWKSPYSSLSMICFITTKFKPDIQLHSWQPFQIRSLISGSFNHFILLFFLSQIIPCSCLSLLPLSISTVLLFSSYLSPSERTLKFQHCEFIMTFAFPDTLSTYATFAFLLSWRGGGTMRCLRIIIYHFSFISYALSIHLLHIYPCSFRTCAKSRGSDIKIYILPYCAILIDKYMIMYCSLWDQ